MRELTYAEALREGLRQAMTADERVFVMGEDIGVYGGAFGVDLLGHLLRCVGHQVGRVEAL